MRKTVTSTVIALSLLGGGAAGVALAAPSIASADDATTTASESPPQWMTGALSKLVDDGTLTQAQADAVAAALDAAKPAMGPGGPGGRGPGLSAAATAIGVSADDLHTALQSGQTIAEVAAAHGVDTQVVIDAIVTDMQSHLADAVADGRITQAQADERSANAAQRATDLVNGALPAPPAGGQGGDASA